MQTPIHPLGQPFEATLGPSSSAEPASVDPSPSVSQDDGAGDDQTSTMNDSLSRSEAASTSTPTVVSDPVDIGLICVSGMAEFDAVRGWCATAAEV